MTDDDDDDDDDDKGMAARHLLPRFSQIRSCQHGNQV